MKHCIKVCRMVCALKCGYSTAEKANDGIAFIKYIAVIHRTSVKMALSMSFNRICLSFGFVTQNLYIKKDYFTLTG